MVVRNLAVHCCWSVLLAYLLDAQAVLGQEKTDKPNTNPVVEAGSNTPVPPKTPLSGPKHLKKSVSAHCLLP